MTDSPGLRLLDRAQCFATGAGVALLCAAALWAWSALKPSLPAVPGAPAAPVAGIATETKPCTTVQVLAPPAKKKLGLPKAIQQDEQASVLAAVAVPHVDYPQIATSLLHRATGLGEIYFTPQPRPWLAFDRRWTAGAFYTATADTATWSVRSGWQFRGSYELWQVKFLHVGLTGQFDLDRTPDPALGIGAWASGR